MSGFTFNGVHSKTKYIASIRTNRTLIPERKHSYIQIPYSNNVILIPDTSKQPFTQVIECFVTIPNGKSIYDVGREWAMWLVTENWAPLVFDDDPNYYYEAISISSIVVEDLRFKKANTITLEFLCKGEVKAVGI